MNIALEDTDMYKYITSMTAMVRLVNGRIITGTMISPDDPTPRISSLLETCRYSETIEPNGWIPTHAPVLLPNIYLVGKLPQTRSHELFDHRIKLLNDIRLGISLRPSVRWGKTKSARF